MQQYLVKAYKTRFVKGSVRIQLIMEHPTRAGVPIDLQPYMTIERIIEVVRTVFAVAIASPM